MAPRSRTGCLTCRQRKLKCSEERPVCSQCIKANRECIPSSGITFRHQQNPSLNGADAGDANSGSLKSFYGYKETFGKGVRWVAVPKDLTFIHTTNPFQEQPFRDENGDAVNVASLTSRSGGDLPPMTSQTQFSSHETALDENDSARDYSFALNHAAYPAYATHGLEALSAVASQDPYNHNYSQSSPPTTQNQHTVSNTSHLQQQDHYEESTGSAKDSLAGQVEQQQRAHQEQDIAIQAMSSPNMDYMLNPNPVNFALAAAFEESRLEASGDNSNIDPRLHAALLSTNAVSSANNDTSDPSTAPEGGHEQIITGVDPGA